MDKALSLLVLLFLFACPSRAQIVQQIVSTTHPVSGGAATNFAYVAGSVTGCYDFGASTVGACKYALHTNPGAGNLLVCAAIWDSTSFTLAITGSSNGTLTPIGSPKTGAGTLATFSAQNFAKFSTVSGAETITAQLSGGPIGGPIIWECALYTYTGTLSSLDGTPQYSNTAASGSVATISGLTTSNPSDLVLATFNGGDSNSTTVGAGYTGRNDTNSCNYNDNTSSCNSIGNDLNAVSGMLIEEKTGVAAGAQTATFGTAGATDNVILGLTGF